MRLFPLAQCVRCDKSDNHNWKHSSDLGMNLLIAAKGLLAPSYNLLLAEGLPGDLTVLKITPHLCP